MEKHEAWNHLFGVRFDLERMVNPEVARISWDGAFRCRNPEEHRVDNVDVRAIDDN